MMAVHTPDGSQYGVLERVATGAPPSDTLLSIAKLVEAQGPELVCSILLFDTERRTLRHGAAPSLPPDAIERIDGVVVGLGVGSCGTAAQLGDEVIVEDIATHPYWELYRDIVLPHGLRACWSTPIFSAERELLGTFALYLRESRGPTPVERELVASATHLAAIAILRERSERLLRQSEARARQLARLYSVSSRVNEAIARLREPADLYDVACRIPVEQGLAELAWVGLYDEARDEVVPVARFGRDDGYVDAIRLRLRDAAIGQGPAATALRTGGPAVTNDVATDPDFHYREEALARGLRSCAVFPLHEGDQPVGVLALYGAEAGLFREEEVRVLAALADDISFALGSAASERERQRLVSALGERVKELTLLHRAARVLQPERPVDAALLADLVELVPAAWQFPDLCAARIQWGSLEAKTGAFRETPWQLSARFGQLGAIDVVYLEQPPVAEPEPFLSEERELVRSLGDLLASHFRRAAAEHALRQNEELLRIAGQAARLGAWSLALPGGAITWSEEVCAIHDLPPGTSPTLEELVQFCVPEWRSALLQAVQDAVAGGGGFDRELEIETAQGRRVWVRVMGNPEYDASGRCVRLQGAIQDVSERRQLEAELRQAQKMEAIGQLAGGIAHDFNNLLSVILSYAVLVRDGLAASDPAREDLDEIARASTRAAELTQQLLAFSRKQVLEPQELDLGRVLVHLQKMVVRLIGPNVRLSLRPSPALGLIWADPGQIEQVILNLVVNARDAMNGAGSITLETQNMRVEAGQTREVEPGDYVLLSVTDTGAGMDEHTRARIFEPFFTTKELGKGTGLGLSTVWGIVTQSGGHIVVESEVGQGTTFRIYLRRVDRSAREELVRRESRLPRPATLRGTETILLVEDQDQVRVLAREILERAGYRVLDAQNGGEAFLIAEQHDGCIHLLLTDVVMPRMSGPELALRITAMRPDLRVLYMSGYAEDESIQREGVGADNAFLAKPFTPEKLLGAVRGALGAAGR